MTSPSSPRVQVSTWTSSPRATWCAMATPGREGLVVGVGVDEEQPRGTAVGLDTVEQVGHWTTAMSANSTTPPLTVLADRLRTSEPAM